MPKLEDLLKRSGEDETRETSIEYEGETVVLTYRPGVFPPLAYKVQSQIAHLAKQSEKKAAIKVETAAEAVVDLATVLCEMLAGWDVLDTDGEPLPIERNILLLLPVQFLLAVFFAIAKEPDPNAAKTAKN